MKLNEYEKVIIKDVESKNYSRDRKILLLSFTLIAILFIIIYFMGFYGEFLDNLKFILTQYRDSFLSSDQDFKTFVYNFNKMIIFIIFFFFFVIFCLLAFFAFDILSRNRVISFYQKKLKDDDGD